MADETVSYRTSLVWLDDEPAPLTPDAANYIQRRIEETLSAAFFGGHRPPAPSVLHLGRGRRRSRHIFDVAVT